MTNSYHWKGLIWLIASIAAVLLAVKLLWPVTDGHKPFPAEPTSSEVPQPPLPPPEFVGRASCASCHAEQDKLWQGSHHDLAMQEANAQTVLGNFDNASFKKGDLVSRFFRRDGKFIVNTDGADGKLADFEVKYTFGYTPLQQYLVEFPGGRLQALSIAWDSRPKEQGGQRWFHLYPNETITHTDELHWTKLSQNWNYMCAECHSTNLQKNYDQTSKSYHTTWSEINVSCEACHGPGSNHVAWAKAKDNAGGKPVDKKSELPNKGLTVLLNERRGVQWAMDAQTGNARRSTPRNTDQEIQTCARCHARRAQLFADYQHGQPLMNTHLPSLLQENLYFADGQIDGEVYEYGSILQSKMAHAGVTCSDCHEPHSLKLRMPGNGVCLQCHAEKKYAANTHHFHPTGSNGSHCVDCHMPPKNYMVVDPRRDHSFRIPRPDLTVKIGVPNACNGCHSDKQPTWAAEQVKQWYGHDPKGFQDYAETLHAARSNAVDAENKLLALVSDKGQPAIARGTAIAELGHHLTEVSLPTVIEALNDEDPLVRAAAVEALDALSPQQRWQVAHPLLRDPSRVVRALTAGTLAGIATEQVPDEDQEVFQQAIADYLASQQMNADEPGAQVNLGNFHAARNERMLAEASYREALSLNPEWVPAYVNLADFYRQSGREAEGDALLRQGLTLLPKSAALHHSLGLLQVRQKQMKPALDSLKRSVELAPNDARFAYVYAIALDSTGKNREARTVVETALKHSPGDAALNQLKLQWATKQ